MDAEAAGIDAASLRAAVEELGRRAIERAAPDELITFDLVLDDYRADPQRTLAKTGGDAAVGFGLDLVALAPFALAVSSAVIGFLLDLVKETATDAAKTSVSEAIRRLFGRPTEDTRARPPAEAAPLSQAQNHQVYEVATQQGLALGLDQERAALLGHAIVGALAAGPA